MPAVRFAQAADRALRASVKVTAELVDLARRPPAGVVILLYHRVGAETCSTVDLPLETFEEQMALLADSAHVVPLADALKILAGGSGEPCVAVTFDDGTADLVELALPVLVRYRVPSTWYLATSFIDTPSSAAGAGRPLSWSGVRDACSTGLVSPGSHTHSHRLLDRIADSEVADELDRSIQSIEDNVGIAPVDFAYPKGLLGTPAAQEGVRARFRSAALAGTCANVVGHTDPYRLARSPIQVDDGRRWFERKVAGGMALEDALRGMLNRYRHSEATT
ncbi:MAG: polysaccharide deacetylase family protein [Microthrixaceae bacterium]